jgi:hypothetical protein
MMFVGSSAELLDIARGLAATQLPGVGMPTDDGLPGVTASPLSSSELVPVKGFCDLPSSHSLSGSIASPIDSDIEQKFVKVLQVEVVESVFSVSEPPLCHVPKQKQEKQDIAKLPRQGGPTPCLEGCEKQETAKLPRQGGVGPVGHAHAVEHLPVMLPRFMTEQQKFVDVPLTVVVKIVRLGAEAFRVVVPQRLNKPISRIYCRRSMNKTDWHEEYVENDMLVTGHVEVDGDWLCLRAGCYLPLRVGELKVLEPMPLQDMLVKMIDHPA